MTIYNIKTLKNNNDTWNKPSSLMNLEFQGSITEHNKQIIYAVLTMLFETKKYPIYARFYEDMGDIKTYKLTNITIDHSKGLISNIRTKTNHCVLYYDNYILDNYTLYKINDEEERKKVKRIIKIKNIL